MKKPLLILLALGAGLSPAGAGPFELPFLDFLSPTPDQPGAEAQRRADSPQAVCKEVDVAVDEGYGVSRRERRVVCDQER
ncbi:MAG TPA: hypothetical protein VIG55_08525 [Methylosinus sp.]|jgi:hypothetical protein